MIIGITGKAGSGKSSLAGVLVEQGYIKRAFADKLKHIAKKYFLWDGQKNSKGRELLQKLGTECGRAYKKDLWCFHLMMDLDEELSKSERCIVIDDVRFENEINFVKNYEDGIIIKLVGKSYDMGKLGEHESEQDLQNYDYLIDIPDMGSKEKFKMEVFDKLKGLEII